MACQNSDFTLAASGDAIITQRISVYKQDDGIANLVDLIRTADASFVNLEVLLHDYEGFPAATSGGTYMRAPPWAADELSWCGFNLFAAATNHVGDYSHGGMQATMRELEERELAYAGLGETLADARTPAYLDTSGGRVGLVAACSTITTGTEAGEQRDGLQGRPGLAPLHLRPRYRVPKQAYDSIQTLSEELGLEAVKERKRRLGFEKPNEQVEDGFRFLNVGGDQDIVFEPANEFGVTYSVEDDDLAVLLDQIRAARRQADWVVMSLHTHEAKDGHLNAASVPDFLKQVAHACIDAGADAFIAHGPHLLRGIEIYDGAPIFYSLGNLFMQNETVTKLPAELYERYNLGADSLPADLFDARVVDDDAQRIGFLADRRYWESVLPICNFAADGNLTDVKLYPINLGFDADRPQRGRPRLAEERATQILSGLAEASKPFDTDIRIGNTGGVIEF